MYQNCLIYRERSESLVQSVVNIVQKTAYRENERVPDGIF
jgi:hypothetical protein